MRLEQKRFSLAGNTTAHGPWPTNLYDSISQSMYCTVWDSHTDMADKTPSQVT